MAVKQSELSKDMKKIYKGFNKELEEIELASQLYRDKSNKYHDIAMLWLIPLFIGTIIMSCHVKIGFIIWIGSVLISMFYSYLSNKYLNKYRKELSKIFKKEI